MSETIEAVRLYSIPSVAERLDVSRATVYRLIKGGKFLTVRLGDGGDQRVRSDDLQRYIDGLGGAGVAS